ncbi:MAG: hypothetical protein H7A45_03415 [Verrucomicrobiales bacterium]|nr:hypothetical protein [Verrucomicrobiales bacterium]MCP5527757.1 hypothetical protein [Verrucomicrobiales bacterium]
MNPFPFRRAIRPTWRTRGGRIPMIGGWLSAALVCMAAADLPEFDFSQSDVARRWSLNAHIGAASITPEGLALTITGGDPYLSGPPADYPVGEPLWLRLRLRSDTGGTCQLFYYESAPTEPNSVRFAVPAGRWVEGRVPVPALGPGHRIRIDPPGTSGRATLVWLRAEARSSFPEFDFRTIPDATDWTAAHDIASLSSTDEGLSIAIGGSDPYLHGPARNYPTGRPLWLHLRVKSEVGGPAQIFYFQDHATEDNSVHFFVPPGAWQDVQAPMPALGRGWRLRFDPPGTAGSCLVERLWFAERFAFAPPVWPRPLPISPGPDPLEVRAGDLRLRQAPDRLGAFDVRVADSLMAAGHPAGLLGYVRANEPSWIPFGNDPAHPVTAAPRDDGGLTVESRFEDPHGALWRVRQDFTASGDGAISVTVQVVVNQDREVLHLPLFTVLPGLGSFGTNKVQALFSGLEYLANEPSSSEADIRGDGARRQAPDRKKITQPLMALASGGRYVGLVWEPDERVAAVFDSPDRLFGGAGHLFGLVAPGSDGYNRDEGSLVPYAPLHLAANRPLVVRCTLIGGRGETVVPAIRHYVDMAGLPELPEPGLSAAEYYAEAARGWLDSRLREGDLYRHAWWPGFNPQPAADAAVWMSWLAGRIDDAGLTARLLGAAQEALRAVPGVQNYNGHQIGHVRYPLPALCFNQAFANASQAGAAGWGMLGQFEPDGSVRYRPAPGGPDYGETHFAPDANGLTATVVLGLLENAAFSGDDALIAEALARLRAMDKFRNTVPRGAQTWEVPLHTPDILAAANLVRCYTLAFQLTADSDWLEQARYWAWTGVPFVYLTPPVSGAVGKYATIPVFGATAWVGSWFGRPVQWCGLVYADALNRLAAQDPAGPWRRIADGIAASGVQQSWTATDADRVGLLPDFYLLDAQYRDGPAINPATVLGPAVRFYGADSPYTFHTFPDAGLRLHAPGALLEAAETADRVRFTVRCWSASPNTVYLNGLRAMPQVRLDGVETELTAPHQFDATTGRLALRLRGTVTVEVAHTGRPALQIRRAEAPGAIELWWPRQNEEWRLLETPSLGIPLWNLITTPVQPIGDMVKTTVAIESTAAFFRLQESQVTR